MIVLVTVEAIALAVMAVLVAGLLRSHAEILRRLHDAGLGIDEDARGSAQVAAPRVAAPNRAGDARVHDLAGRGLHDDAVVISVAGVAHRTLIAFLSSGCVTCHEFWRGLASSTPVAADVGDVRIVVVTKDPSEESIAALRELAPRRVPVLMSSASWIDYEVPGSPYFVLVDGPSARVLGEGTGVSFEQLGTLIEQSLGDAGELGDERERRIDRELLEFGIRPGDPSLFRTADEIRRRS